jgi:cyclase
MLAVRIIPCLDVEDGRVVKGIRFRELRDAGDPVELAALYNSQGADEIVFLDIGASYKSRDIMIEVVERVSREVFIPLTVGGGIRSVDDMRRILHAGADKVALCTAAIKDPSLLSRGAEAFGSQCIVLSVDAKREGGSWHAYTNGGRDPSGLDAAAQAAEGERLGAGEILLNSIDMDGTREGYDLELTRTVSESVGIPVIASGGAGTMDQIVDAVREGKAEAVLLASLFHYREVTIAGIKDHLRKEGVCVR